MRWNTTSSFAIEVQFEDIDGGGVVHHPNYLRYLERGRCQAMREIGVPFEKCLKDGIAFVVAEVNSKYLMPLQFGQRICVLTRLVAMRKSSLKVFQKIVAAGSIDPEDINSADFFKLDKNTFFISQLRLVAVELASGRPISVPQDLRVAGNCPSEAEFVSNPAWTNVRLQGFTSDSQ
ncbi:acyl-CoA thioesterase [bacterium]|nr:acyl-CoA thioesterase [bacterium]